MNNLQIAGLILLTLALIIAIQIISKQRLENDKLKANIATLELNQKINEDKLTPIIEYRDKKIEIIKKVPIYLGSDCEEKLKNYENIVNSF